MNDPVNSGKTLLQVANTIKLPASICTSFQQPKCDWNNRYQYLDGSCNNMKKPWLGKAATPYKRFLPPEYADTLSSPRSQSVTSKQQALPNTRVISRTIQNDNGQFESSWTHLGTLFGQFIAHDLTSLSSTSDSQGVAVNCPCDSTNTACLSVPMPSNENIMTQSCMQFTRSSAVFPTYDCSMGHREQLNLLSSHLDGTQIYGESYNVSLQLRKLSSGLFSTSAGITARPYLIKSDSLCTNTNDTQLFCFKAGEFRTSENLGLTGIQVLFMREHNRIATELASLNKNWNDDTLYYETKRIVVAIYNHIIYNQWLPTVLGKKFHLQSGLAALSSGFFTGYDDSVNPALFNEFAGAALRFGHSLVRNQLNRYSPKTQVVGMSLNISKLIFQVDEAYK
jgi:peroxidase